MFVLLERDMGKRIKFVDEKTKASGQTKVKNQSGDQFEAEWAELTGAAGGVVKKSKGDSEKTSLSSLSDVRVSPLVQSKWGQSTWNNYKTFNLYTPNNYYCGCVATAFAQIMRYWQKPVNSVTAQSRTCKVSGTLTQKTMYGGTYSWSNMPLTSSSCSSATQRQAIGKLLYDMGVAFQMSWASDGSGTMGFAGSHALKNVFGYASSQAYFDIGGYGLQSSLSSQTDFRDAILASLDAGMPCAVGVSGDEGGHEMVLDGYGFSGSVIYSHINCGWSGSEDAWYNFFGEYVTSCSFAYMDELGYNIHPTTTGDVLSGRVLNSSGNPVSGATVTLTFGGTTRTTSTNAKGIYYFRISSAGTYAVSASYGSQTGSTTATVASMSASTTAAFDSSRSWNRNSSKGTLGNKWGVNVTLGSSQPQTTGDTYDPSDDTPSGGTYLSPTATVQTHGPHTLSSTDRYDFFRVWMTAGNKYVFESTGSYDMYGELFNSTSTNAAYRVAYNDDGGDSTNFKIQYTPTWSGTYYLRVRRYSVGSAGTYSLKYSIALPQDNFSDAAQLSGSYGESTGSNVGATAESYEPLTSYRSSAKNSIWWAWKAPFTGTVRFSTEGTSFDTVMGVYSGYSLQSLAMRAQDDDTGANRTSVCSFSAVSGVTYYIAVAGYNGAGGTVKLNWRFAPSCVVKLNANGGKLTGVAWKPVTKGKKVGSLKSPTRSGYAFAGWYTKKSGGAKVSSKQVIKKSMTLFARWKAKKYTVKLKKTGGGTVSGGGKKAYKSAITLKAVAAKGYVFQGWYKDGVLVSSKATWKTKVPLNGATYTAKFVKKSTKAADGPATAAGASGDAGASTLAAALPASTCGTFHGWTWREEDGVRVPSMKVTVSVTSAGKISATVGGRSFSGTGWTRSGDDGATLCAALEKDADVLTLTLDPAKGWTEDQLSGSFSTFGGEEVVLTARRDSFGDNEEAKAVAAELSARETTVFADADGTEWKLKVSANGVATAVRITGTAECATAVLEVSPALDGNGYVATARFLVGGKVVEATFP